MTKEEREMAIEYFKFHRKIFCDDHLKICPKNSIAYQATIKEKSFYDMAIQALEQEPCEAYISRSSIIKTLNKMDRYVADELTLCDTERKYPQNEVFIVDDVYEEIAEQLPAITPQPKTGHWIRVDDTKMRCSNCDIIHLIAQYPRVGINYCPNCGAKMIEPQESEGEE